MSNTATTPPTAPQKKDMLTHDALIETVPSSPLDLASESLKISIILPTNAYFMSGIRDFTMTVAQNMTGFSEKWAYRLQTVVDELTNNAIEFGSRPGDNIKITFVSRKGRMMEVFVEDQGNGKHKTNAAEMRQYLENHKHIDPTTITSIRGRGLSQIVSHWADTIEFLNNSNGGLTTHIVKYLKPEERFES